MSLANILGQFWLKELTQVSDKGQLSLKDWLKKGRFTVSKPIDDQTFELIAYKPERKSTVWAIGAIASDINRFASAAFESIDTHGIDQTFKKSISWHFIRSYYAAFYGAHALLRIFGQSVSQLDRETLSEIEKIASLYGMRPLDATDPIKEIFLKNGIYVIDVIDNEDHYVLKGKRLDSKNGGTHELMWVCFNKLLGDLQLQLLSEKATGVVSDLIEASDTLGKIRASISNGGYNNGNWLSSIRNRINYNHQFEVWFPFGKPDNYYETLGKLCEFDWNSELSISGHAQTNADLQGFLETCGKIVLLCKDSVEQIDKRSQLRFSFLRKHAYSYLIAAKDKTNARTLA